VSWGRQPHSQVVVTLLLALPGLLALLALAPNPNRSPWPAPATAGAEPRPRVRAAAAQPPDLSGSAAGRAAPGVGPRRDAAVLGGNHIVSLLGLGSGLAFVWVYLLGFAALRRTLYLICAARTVISLPYLLVAGRLIAPTPSLGPLEAQLAASSAAAAAVLAVYTTHHSFDLPRPARAWPLTGAAVLATALAGAAVATLRPAATAVALASFAAVIGHHLAVLVRMRRQRPGRVVTIYLLVWVAVVASAAIDLLGWLDGGELLGGFRVGIIAVLLVAALEIAALITVVIDTMRSTTRLNRDLQARIDAQAVDLSLAMARLDQLIPAAELQPGHIVDQRYRVVNDLGSGARGRVYQVERLADQQRLVLKILRQTDDVAAVVALARQVHLAGEIDHPNVAALVDFSFSDLARLYVVSEYVDGLPVARFRDHFGDARWAIPILRAAASGLAAGHEKGIAHGDLRPANLFLTTRGRRVKITDFAVANVALDRACAASAALPSADEAALALSDLAALAVPPDAAPLARPGNTRRGPAPRMGNPRYLAPELADPDSSPTAAADVFSFAVLAFELITGKLPFATPPFLARLGGSVAAEAAPLPRALPVTAELAQLVDAALAAVPERRPPLTEILQALVIAREQMRARRLSR
jgi:hypothetical protein